jgi:CRISPR-associated endonuclease/helicase Cas3
MVIEKNLDTQDVNLSEVAYIVGVLHDLAKSTNFFQKYIIETDESKKRDMKAKETTHHALLSSFFTYAIMNEYIGQRTSSIKAKIEANKIERKRKWELAELIPIISFLIVKRHHSNLKDARIEIGELYSERVKIFRVVEEQLNAIDLLVVQEILDQLLTDEIGLKIDIHRCVEYIRQDMFLDIIDKDEELVFNLDQGLLPYLITQFLYSVLLDADKSDAGLYGIHLSRPDIASDLVDRYKEMEFSKDHSTGINPLRNQIYDAVVAEVSNLKLQDRILSLNVPTGIGKTLTALSFALKLRERLQKEQRCIPRIVYALPYLSIIDQNYDGFERVFAKTTGVPDSRMLLKHHHLTKIAYETDEDEYDIDKSLLLMEGWNAEIIVTTFWQVFHTIFTNRKKMVRKFNKIASAIIILDEVQSIPTKYWTLVHDYLEAFCKLFNSYVIFVTATQPMIFDETKREIRELATKKAEYFQCLDRIELHPPTGQVLNLEEFQGIIEEFLIREKDKDFLIVLNTISSANKVYNYVKTLALGDTKKFYLSTHIVPKQRLKKINEIKSCKLRKVIVSTQLIEAGVDIDADIVYRDLGPLDSINQVAGRCNRNSVNGRGQVFVVILEDEKKKELYKYIYDTFLMNTTLEILKPIKGHIRESDFLELNNRYFKAVKRGISEEKSKENLVCLKQLAFQTLSEKFKLIEEDYEKVDVFVELDKKAAEIWKDYQDLKFEKDLLEKMRRRLKIRNGLNDYMISIPKKYAATLINENSEIGYISNDELSNYYDLETGFMRDGAGGGSMIT